MPLHTEELSTTLGCILAQCACLAKSDGHIRQGENYDNDDGTDNDDDNDDNE